MKKFFVTLLTLSLVAFSATAFAASRNHSDWFDLDRINAVEVNTNLTRKASREEVALLVAHLCDEHGLLPSKRALDFDDEDDFSTSSSYRDVTDLATTGIVGGYPDGEFKPENNITRAEALAIVLRTVDYLNLETETYRKGSSFTDIKAHWAEPYCERAYEMGIVSGRGNGRFYPNDNITREEIITILVNLMGESNNPLIGAIDKVYDLEFENSYYEEDDGYYNDNNRYNDRYYDDDDRYYDGNTERPVVDTGDYVSNNGNNNYTNSNNERPERPVVSVDTTNDTDNVATDNGSRPSRPVVDTTSETSTSTSVERPTVEVEKETASSGRPTRPTV